VEYKPTYNKKTGLAECGACGKEFPGGSTPARCPKCGKEAEWKSFPAVRADFLPLENAAWKIEDHIPEGYKLKAGGERRVIVIPSEHRDSVKKRAAKMLGFSPEDALAPAEFEIVSVTPMAPYMAKAKGFVVTKSAEHEVVAVLCLADGGAEPHLESVREAS
jgi:hypothetical protein